MAKPFPFSSQNHFRFLNLCYMPNTYITEWGRNPPSLSCSIAQEQDTQTRQLLHLRQRLLDLPSRYLVNRLQKNLGVAQLIKFKLITLKTIIVKQWWNIRTVL